MLAVPYNRGVILAAHAGATASDISTLSISQQRHPESSAAEPSQVVRTLASNGQPRKILAPSGTSVPGAPTEAASGTQPTSIASGQREVRRTASNGQPRKGLSFSRLTENRQTSFRNR